MPIFTKKLFAEDYVVSSSVVSMSIAQASGSTIFGDTADDTHLFIGNTISGSATSTASFGKYENIVSFAGADGTEPLFSGSAASTGSFGQLNIKQQKIYEKSNDLVLESTPNSDHIVFRTGDNDGAALDKNGSFIIGRGATVPASNHSGGHGSLTVYNNGTSLIKIANSTTGQDANSGTDLMGLSDEFLIINREAGDIRLKTNNNNFIFDGVANTWSGSATSTGSFGQVETAGDLKVAIPSSGASGFRVDTSVEGHTELKLNNRTIFVNDDIIAIGEDTAPNDLAHQKGGGAGGRSSVYIGNEAGENVDNSDGGAANNTFIGNIAGQDVTSGAENTFVGAGAGSSVTTGNNNVIIGRSSNGETNITSNIIIGHSAGSKVGANGGGAQHNIILGNGTVSGTNSGGNVDHNIIMGYRASKELGDAQGSYNVHLGYEAASNVVTASYNVAIGYQAMEDAGGASSGGSHVTKNIAIGYRPLVKISGSSNCEHNVVLGTEAANNNGSGKNNIVMGYRAAYNNSGDLGQHNIFMGTSTGNDIDGGDYNVCLNKNAGASLTTANDNILIGQGAGFNQTTGNHIIALGKNAGRGSGITADTNDQSIFIGKAAYSSEAGATNETVIGNEAIGKGSNTVVLGDDNVTDIYLSEDKGAIVYGGTFSGSAFIDDGTQLNVPDYVFEPEYDLKSLEYVETHISQSKHLPGVPSRDDKNGWVSYDMGGRDMLLLEKIEELTLYVIRLEKRIKDLENN